MLTIVCQLKFVMENHDLHEISTLAFQDLRRSLAGKEVHGGHRIKRPELNSTNNVMSSTWILIL